MNTNEHEFLILSAEPGRLLDGWRPIISFVSIHIHSWSARPPVEATAATANPPRLRTPVAQRTRPETGFGKKQTHNRRQANRERPFGKGLVGGVATQVKRRASDGTAGIPARVFDFSFGRDSKGQKWRAFVSYGVAEEDRHGASRGRFVPRKRIRRLA